nr:acetyl-coA carboxylase beta subunit [Albidella nymphaeifolia]
MGKWWWFFPMFSYLPRRCDRDKPMYTLRSIKDVFAGEAGALIRNQRGQNISSWNDNESFSNDNESSHSSFLISITGTSSLTDENNFLVRDSNGNEFLVYFDIESETLGIYDEYDEYFKPFRNNENDPELFYNYLISGCLSLKRRNESKNEDHEYYYYYRIYDTQSTKSSWNKHITSHIRSIESVFSFSGDTVNSSDSSISYFSDSDGSISDLLGDYLDRNKDADKNEDLNINNNPDRSNDPDRNQDPDKNEDLNINNDPSGRRFKDLWFQCENCYELNYHASMKSNMSICEHCGYHLKMSSLERIELLVDKGTWDPINEDMVFKAPIGFELDPEEQAAFVEARTKDEAELIKLFELEDREALYKFLGLSLEKEGEAEGEELDEEEKMKRERYGDYIDSSQRKTGLTDAVQTGIGQLNGIPIAIGVMDFEFIGGSMGSVVGEKITRLIEYASALSLPLIIVCASGGARMQEGSLSLTQMAKISSALYDYQINKKSFYVSILTSPTTGGVTASFGMLGDVVIAEPEAYIAFAGKRVIEETLNKEVPEESQESECLFYQGLLDLIVPRNFLKGVLSELFQLHGFLPLNQN